MLDGVFRKKLFILSENFLYSHISSQNFYFPDSFGRDVKQVLVQNNKVGEFPWFKRSFYILLKAGVCKLRQFSISLFFSIQIISSFLIAIASEKDILAEPVQMLAFLINKSALVCFVEFYWQLMKMKIAKKRPKYFMQWFYGERSV